MKFGKREISFIVGIAVALLIWVAPLPGLEGDAKIMFALTIMTVIFWAQGVAQNGYTAGLLLVLMCLLLNHDPDTGGTPIATIFYAWTGTTIWLIVGAYLIANVVKTSGLGDRIAYLYMGKFVTGYNSIIIGIFVLTAVMSLLIPHPWPRAFLIMAVMKVVIESSGIEKEDAVKIGFCVFAASVPCSLIFITGDATINPLAASYFGGATFAQWVLYMGIPAIIASVLTLVLFLVMFKPTKEYSVNKEEIAKKLAEMGPMGPVERKTAIWVIIAVVLWATDSIHGIDIGWITLGIGMLLAMPIIGDLNGPKDWGAVPLHVLVFLTAAMAIGKVGGTTGMNAWIASFLPSNVAGGMIVIALIIVAISMIVHMLLGSVIAVMGVAVPAILSFCEPLGITPIAATLICYMTVAGHYEFPFQHLNMLVGATPDTGNYTQAETLKLGTALIPVMFILGVVMAIWFQIIGVAYV